MYEWGLDNIDYVPGTLIEYFTEDPSYQNQNPEAVRPSGVGIKLPANGDKEVRPFITVDLSNSNHGNGNTDIPIDRIRIIGMCFCKIYILFRKNSHLFTERIM